MGRRRSSKRENGITWCLNTLGKLNIHDLCSYNGIGEAKAITILAACELGKRRQMEKPEDRPDLGTATRIYNHMHPRMQDLDVEEFWVLLMNQHHRLIKPVRISHGGITETSVDIRIIMREAILANTTILAACHNHPSGNLHPSKYDEELTRSIKRACELFHGSCYCHGWQLLLFSRTRQMLTNYK